MTTTQTITADLTAARRAYYAAVENARTYQDPDLTPEALTRQRQDREAAARTAYAQALRPIREDYERAARLNAKALAKVPAPAPGATDGAWRRVEARLGAGATLDDLIAISDVEMLQAIRVEGPTYLAINGGDPAGSVTLPDRLDRATLARYAAITEDTDMAAALAEAPTLAGLAVTLDDAEAEAQGIPGAGGLNGAVAAALAAQAAGSTTVDPDTTA